MAERRSLTPATRDALLRYVPPIQAGEAADPPVEPEWLAAFKWLVICARMSGGVAGRDNELVAACERAESAIELLEQLRQFDAELAEVSHIIDENPPEEAWRALLVETLGHLDAYGFSNSQFNGLRRRIRDTLGEVG